MRKKKRNVLKGRTDTPCGGNNLKTEIFKLQQFSNRRKMVF